MNRKTYKYLILGLIIPLWGCAQKTETQPQTEVALAEFLDGNQDGTLNPYEVLDVMFQLQEEHVGDMSIKDFNALVAEIQDDDAQEEQEMFDEFDTNGDGKITEDEVNEEMIDIVLQMDTDQSGGTSFAEFTNFDFTEGFLADDEEIKEMVDGMFMTVGKDEILLSEMDEEDQNEMKDLDNNRDGTLTREEVTSFMTINNTPAFFEVEGTTAYMNGVICSDTPADVLRLLLEHPEVTTIEMRIVPGSIDDVANLRAALYVHKFGLDTKVNSQSYIASGGTDFFLAGNKRTVEDGARIGVHSWAGGNVPAIELPKDDPEHQKYLEYYRALDIPESFYWYTLEAAPAAGMHEMTEEEINTYKVKTE